MRTMSLVVKVPHYTCAYGTAIRTLTTRDISSYGLDNVMLCITIGATESITNYRVPGKVGVVNRRLRSEFVGERNLRIQPGFEPKTFRILVTDTLTN